MTPTGMMKIDVSILLESDSLFAVYYIIIKKHLGGIMQTKQTALLSFATPELSDFSTLKQYLSPFRAGSMSCEATPITLLMWNALYHQKIAFFEDMLFVSLGEQQEYFLLPFAADLPYAVGLLRSYTASLGIPLRFLAADGERFDQFRAAFENEFSITESREDFEYLYQTKKLRELSGKKFHAKRNHISAFTRDHQWRYETMSKDNLVDFFDTSDQWLAAMLKTTEDTTSILVENAAMKALLPHMEELGLKGGGIRVDGSLVAMTFGSPINQEVFDIHVEKALPDYRTAYSLINREFIAHELQTYRYVNREDDMGLEGLRRAKLSYHPDILLKKYIVEELRP